MAAQGRREPRRRVLAARGGDDDRTRFKRRASVFLRAPLAAAGAVLAIALAPTAAHADGPLSWEPAIDRGVTHLEGVQLPDGGFEGRLAVRDSATAGEALRLARPASPAIAGIDAYLSPLDVGDVDSL